MRQAKWIALMSGFTSTKSFLHEVEPGIRLNSSAMNKSGKNPNNRCREANTPEMGFVESMSRCGLNPGSKDTERRLFRCEGLASKARY